MLTIKDKNLFPKRFLAFIFAIICLAFSILYLLYCLHSVYSFNEILQSENPTEITHCSVCIGSYGQESDGIVIPLESDIFNQLLEYLQSEEYKKPLNTVLGKRVSSFPIGTDTFFRILLVHEDKRRTEIVVSNESLMIGASSEIGLKVYQISGGDALLKEINTLF